MAREVTVIPATKTPRAVGKKAALQSKTRVAAYCRVSTEQEEQENSFRNQVDYYTRYIQSHPEYELVDIYADEGISGTNTKKREQFKRMIADCEAHRIDMVITKSISRFARNTQDCLENYRKLKNLGITVVFEKENISSADSTGELLLTILSSLAQDESRNISENTKWGIRSKFQKGIPHINACKFMGFDKSEDGRLIINEEEAKLVRRIYREFLEGFTCSAIAARLNAEGVPGVSGEPKWLRVTIESMLKNEKYMGDSLLQKTYTADFLTKKQVKNEGEITQYYVKDSHEGIVPREEWYAVQQEFDRIEHVMKDHHLTRYGYGGEIRPFSSKIICGECGNVYGRKAHAGREKETYWQCNTRCYTGPKSCRSENVKEEVIHRVFIEAWNKAVLEKDQARKRWERMEKQGTELERLRARQMRELVSQGPISRIVPELVQSVLERILIRGNGLFEVAFLDGTKYEIQF